MNISDKKIINKRRKQDRRVDIGDLVKVYRQHADLKKGHISLVTAIKLPRGPGAQPVVEVLPVGSLKRYEFVQADVRPYKYACTKLRQASNR